jgi:hypothetical protein
MPEEFQGADYYELERFAARVYVALCARSKPTEQTPEIAFSLAELFINYRNKIRIERSGQPRPALVHAEG